MDRRFRETDKVFPERGGKQLEAHKVPIVIGGGGATVKGSVGVKAAQPV